MTASHDPGKLTEGELLDIVVSRRDALIEALRQISAAGTLEDAHELADEALEDITFAADAASLDDAPWTVQCQKCKLYHFPHCKQGES